MPAHVVGECREDGSVVNHRALGHVHSAKPGHVGFDLPQGGRVRLANAFDAVREGPPPELLEPRRLGLPGRDDHLAANGVRDRVLVGECKQRRPALGGATLRSGRVVRRPHGRRRVAALWWRPKSGCCSRRRGSGPVAAGAAPARSRPAARRHDREIASSSPWRRSPQAVAARPAAISGRALILNPSLRATPTWYGHEPTGWPIRGDASARWSANDGERQHSRRAPRVQRGHRAGRPRARAARGRARAAAAGAAPMRQPLADVAAGERGTTASASGDDRSRRPRRASAYADGSARADAAGSARRPGSSHGSRSSPRPAAGRGRSGSGAPRSRPRGRARRSRSPVARVRGSDRPGRAETSGSRRPPRAEGASPPVAAY